MILPAVDCNGDGRPAVPEEGDPRGPGLFPAAAEAAPGQTGDHHALLPNTAGRRDGETGDDQQAQEEHQRGENE